MADRFGFQFTKTLENEVFLLDGYLAAGPDGYVDVTNGTDALPVWMQSITRTGTGAYTVVLGVASSSPLVTDNWVQVQPLVSVFGNTSSDHLVAKCFSVTNTGFKFVVENSTTGTATDLTTGGGLIFLVVVHNSAVQ